MSYANVYLTRPPVGGAAALVGVLRDAGARRVSSGNDSVNHPRVPIDEAIAMGFLEYAASLAVQPIDASWECTVTFTPCVGLRLRGRDSDPAAASGLIDRICEVAELDFAVVLAHEPDSRPRTPAGYRALVASRLPSAVYARQGPVGCGDRTWIGNRLLALLSAEGRLRLSSLGQSLAEAGPLVVEGSADSQRAAEVLANDGVMSRIEARGKWFVSAAGTRWRPPAPVGGTATFSARDWDVVQRLQASVEHEQSTADLAADGLLIPFASLTGIRAQRLEAERATLAFATLDDAVIDDSGLVESDLRGVSARESRWVEVSLHGADLRWADLAGAQLPLSRLDEANCAFIDLTGSTLLESAASACFDHADAAGWAPGPNTELSAATFRHAHLRNANFAGARLKDAVFDDADLRGAVFDGADLSGARFRRADVRAASFRSAILDGVDLTDARRDDSAIG